MSKKQVDISVIIPIYNVELYLEECLNSVLAQSFSNCEIVCVEDASTDNSCEIVQVYAQKHENIKIISHAVNRGLSAARNSGIQAAEGKYLLFMDSDDKMAHNKVLEDLFYYAEKYETEMLYFNFEHRDEGNMQDLIPGARTSEDQPVYKGRDLFCEMMEIRKVGVEAVRVLFKKNFLVENNLFFVEGILHEDILFSFYCMMTVERIVWIKEVYYLYRQRMNSISHVRDKKREKSLFYILSQLYIYWNTHPFTERENNAMTYFFWVAYIQYQQYRTFSEGEEQELPCFNFAERYVHTLAAEKDAVYFNANQIAAIAGAKEVIIYGAGIVGQKVISYLKKLEVEIYRVAVTSKEKNPEMVLDIPVSEITELLNYRDSAVVVVAVKECFAEEIIFYVKELGYANIVTLNYR